MSDELNIGIVQCAPCASFMDSVSTIECWVATAARQGAQIICLPELLTLPYFCKTQDEAHFALAYEEGEHPLIKALADIAAKYSVCLPISFFERDGPHYYNAVVMLDADGSNLGKYRKTHIPDGPGYQEKFYFKPGEALPPVFQTQFGRVGVGICWDQWFPEIARHLTLQGAEVILYPTAIGAEPQDAGLDTKDRWQRVMQGHAVANVIPIAAANRVGIEDGQSFYGSSCIIGADGAISQVLGRTDEGVLVQRFSREALRIERAAWGFFRDRRTDLY